MDKELLITLCALVGAISMQFQMCTSIYTLHCTWVYVLNGSGQITFISLGFCSFLQHSENIFKCVFVWFVIFHFKLIFPFLHKWQVLFTFLHFDPNLTFTRFFTALRQFHAVIFAQRKAAKSNISKIWSPLPALEIILMKLQLQKQQQL